MIRILKYVFLLSLLLFIVGAAGLVYSYVKYPDIPFGAVAVKKIEEQKEFEAKGITVLKVETDTPDVSVISGKDDVIRANLSGELTDRQKNALMFEASQTNEGELSIDLKRGTDIDIFPFQFNGGVKLVITVPQKQFERIELVTGTGDVRMKDMSAKLVFLETSTGTVDVKNGTAQDITISTSTGDIRLSDSKGKMKLETDTGDISATFSKKLEQDLDIDTSTGDVAVQLEELPKALRTELESSTGEVTARITGLQTDRQREHSFKAAYGTDGPLIQIQTSTGDIALTQKNEQGH